MDDCLASGQSSLLTARTNNPYAVDRFQRNRPCRSYFVPDVGDPRLTLGARVAGDSNDPSDADCTNRETDRSAIG